MAYRTDLSNAARRHLRAADELHAVESAGAQPGCRAVAGYLYGLAGELAVKAMMQASGMRPAQTGDGGLDPYYAHFPKLKHQLREAIEGRLAGQLQKIAADDGLFNQWDTRMRYAPTGDVQAGWLTAWKVSAKQLVDAMELL